MTRGVKCAIGSAYICSSSCCSSSRKSRMSVVVKRQCYSLSQSLCQLRLGIVGSFTGESDLLLFPHTKHQLSTSPRGSVSSTYKRFTGTRHVTLCKCRAAASSLFCTSSICTFQARPGGRRWDHRAGSAPVSPKRTASAGSTGGSGSAAVASGPSVLFIVALTASQILVLLQC